MDGVSAAAGWRWVPAIAALVGFGLGYGTAVYSAIQYSLMSAEEFDSLEAVAGDVRTSDLFRALMLPLAIAGLILALGHRVAGRNLVWSWPGVPRAGQMPPTRRILIAAWSVVAVSMLCGDICSWQMSDAPSAAIWDSDFTATQVGALSLSAGIGEELLVLALPMMAMALFTDRLSIVMPVLVVMRLSYHLYYGWSAIGLIVPWAVATVVVLWFWRSWTMLIGLIVIHLVADVFAFGDWGFRMMVGWVAAFAVLPVIILVDMWRTGIRTELASRYQGLSWPEYRRALESGEHA